MNTNRWKLVLSLFLPLLLWTACAPRQTGDQEPAAPPTRPAMTSTPQITQPGLAQVDEVQIMILESFPVQVQALIKGHLPDGCTELDQIQHARQEQRFQITLTTTRPAGVPCTDALVPFEETVALDVLGLKAGEYTVSANGVEASFTLDIDNIPIEEPPPDVGEPASISGRVWHDLCAVAGGEGSNPESPSDGCITLPTGGFAANGNLEDGEPGIEGVQVDLGTGACPASGLASATTNADGFFSFTNLQPGTYCLSVDPDSPANAPLLLPGVWTFPTGAGQVAAVTIEPQPGQSLTAQNFGWDYQFLPEPDQTQACTDRARFVDDITIPDGTVIRPGQTFTKTWRLANEGTCTWTTDYAIVFLQGTRMSKEAQLNLPAPVLPGDTVDLSVRLTAPETAGSFQADWLLANSAGETFGLGDESDKSFWIQIVVAATGSLPNLGTPTWRDIFDDGDNWPLDEEDRYADDHTIFEVVDGNFEMTAKNAESWDSWLLTSIVADDFYLEMSATPQDCAGRDHYGLVFRAPEPNQGYLVGLTCAGEYNLRTWDGEKFTILQDWTPSASIKTGPGKTNQLVVKLAGDEITIFVNGDQIAQITDDTFDEGKFGLFVGAANTPGFKVRVSEIAYWNLSD